MEALIGIDLGTTNCTVTAIDEDGKTFGIKNKFGEYITPSAVYFEKKKNNIIIGKEAKNKSATDPNNLVLFVKREMGNPKEKVRRSGDGEFHPYKFWHKTFSPEEISSFILKQLKDDAEKQLGCKVKKAVITCPAYFGDKEKNATRIAGRFAGFEVLEIIPEPTAAAISYSMKENCKNQTVLVFDLGGGTFDVTVLKIDGEKKVETIATDGNHKLGGKDWDDLIMDFMVEEFNEEAKLDFDYEEGKEKDIAYGKLRLEVENAKVKLFSENTESVNINFSYGGKTITRNLSRTKYARITEKKTDSCRTYCENVLAEACMTWKDIDTILMVGNMSNCRSIQDALKSWSGKEINFGAIDPKTCVSEGAAIKAYRLCNPQKKFDNDKSSVLAYSIGIKGRNRAGDEIIKKMLKKNTAYPCDIAGSFPLSDYENQTLTISLYEGESDNPSECDLLGYIDVQTDGKLKEGEKLDVTISVDNSGILQVEACHKKTGIYAKAKLQREGAMSEEEIQQAEDEIDDFFLG